MDLLTPTKLKAAYALAPSSSWVQGTTPRNGKYGLDRKPGMSGSAGSYQYTPVGGNTAHVHRNAGWRGACFACWRTFHSSNYLHGITYRNPINQMLSYNKEILDPYYAVGWDTVIQPCLPTLPTYAELLKKKVLTFDVDNGSLLEASFLFRIARIFSECESFASNATLLRHAYPDDPPEVLFAQCAFGQYSLNGWKGHNHPAYPNCTVPMYGKVQQVMSFMRNLIWSKKEGRWDVRKLVGRNDSTFQGPHHRQYFGHSPWWHGTKAFKVSLFLKGENQNEQFNTTSVWGNPKKKEQRDIQDLHNEMLNEVYSFAKDMPHTEELKVDMDAYLTIPWYKERMDIAGGHERVW